MNINQILNEELKTLSARNPSSFFESREWRSWAACRRPKDDVWCERRKIAAKLQRTMAATFRLQYLALGLRDSSNWDVTEFFGVGIASIAELEAEAKSYMTRVDVRSAF